MTRQMKTSYLCLGMIAVVAGTAPGQDAKHSEGGKEVASYKTHWDVHSLTLCADEKRIITGNYGGHVPEGTIFVLDATTGKHLSFIRAHGWGVTFGVAVSPDGKRIISGGAERHNLIGELKVWDVDTAKLSLTITGHKHTVYSVAISPDGKHIVAGGGRHMHPTYTGELKVWDALTGKEIHNLAGHSLPVRSVTVSPDGRHVLSGSEDKTVKVWGIQTGKELMTLKGHVGSVFGVTVSADGKRIISSASGKSLGEGQGRTGEIKVWDAVTGKETLALEEPKPVLCVAISPDGKQIASGGHDHAVSVWDADSGARLAILRGHREPVSAVRFSRDGQRIISGGRDGSVKLWEVTKKN